MLLAFPTDILIAIIVIIVFIALGFVFFLGMFNAKQSEDVRNEPEEVKEKSDAPEIPSEGQKEKPIDEMDKIH